MIQGAALPRPQDMRGRFLTLVRLVVVICCFITPVQAAGDRPSGLHTTEGSRRPHTAAFPPSARIPFRSTLRAGPQAGASRAVHSPAVEQALPPLAPDESRCDVCRATVKTDFLDLHMIRNAACKSRADALARDAARRPAASAAAADEGVRTAKRPRHQDEEVARQAALEARVADLDDDMPLPDVELLPQQQEVLDAARSEAVAAPFDSTAELVKFITHLANNAGMRENDINELLRIIRHPSFDPASVKLRNADDVREYQRSLRPEDVSSA